MASEVGRRQFNFRISADDKARLEAAAFLDRTTVPQLVIDEVFEHVHDLADTVRVAMESGELGVAPPYTDFLSLYDSSFPNPDSLPN